MASLTRQCVGKEKARENGDGGDAISNGQKCPLFLKQYANNNKRWGAAIPLIVARTGIVLGSYFPRGLLNFIMAYGHYCVPWKGLFFITILLYSMLACSFSSPYSSSNLSALSSPYIRGRGQSKPQQRTAASYSISTVSRNNASSRPKHLNLFSVWSMTFPSRGSAALPAASRRRLASRHAAMYDRVTFAALSCCSLAW